MDKAAKILAIDDDPAILALIQNILQRERYLVFTQHAVRDVPLETYQGYDLILLDVMMPDIDGFELCRSIRHAVGCPIIFLTAKTEEEAIVKGLMSGGDDYLTKPFGVQELSARVGAHIRREQRERRAVKRFISGVAFDFDSKEVAIEDKKVPLTKNEYKICELLAQNRGRVFTRDEIYDEIYGLEGNALHSSITEFVRSIRSKLRAHGESPITTVWGVGYKWE